MNKQTFGSNSLERAKLAAKEAEDARIAHKKKAVKTKQLLDSLQTCRDIQKFRRLARTLILLEKTRIEDVKHILRERKMDCDGGAGESLMTNLIRLTIQMGWHSEEVLTNLITKTLGD